MRACNDPRTLYPSVGFLPLRRFGAQFRCSKAASRIRQLGVNGGSALFTLLQVRGPSALKLPGRLADNVKPRQLNLPLNGFFHLIFDIVGPNSFVAYNTDPTAPITAPHPQRRSSAR